MTTTYYIQITIGDNVPTETGLKEGILAYSDDGMIAIQLASGAECTVDSDGVHMNHTPGHCFMRDDNGVTSPYPGLYSCLLSGTYTGPGSIVAITQAPIRSRRNHDEPRHPNNTGRPVESTH